MPLIAFGSPKGGVGKTTITAAVAANLAQSGLRVIALDLDPQNALRLHFGMQLHDAAGFAPVLAQPYGGQVPLQFLRQTPYGVSVLPFGQTDAAQALAIADSLRHNPRPLRALLETLLADPGVFVVADSPPGPSAALSALLPYADMLVCVLLADATSVSLIPSIDSGRAFGAGTELARESGRLRFVLNQLDPASRLNRASAEAVRPYLGPRLLGEVRRDEMVAEAVAGQCPLPFFAPGSPAATDLAAIARNIAHAFGLIPA